ncbi:MAG: peptidylprolyl isomerase [Rhodocyclaceae bacterium]|nr:peptidylprolyl isomerase [Rhodocyclaceae bacterium]
MQIGPNTVVTLAYRVTDAQGNLIDPGERPLVYLHGGYGGIFEKIERELEGQAVGFSKDIRLQPEEAFGVYDADLVFVEPRDLFPENIEVGMQFERASDDEEEDGMLYTITNIAEGKVVVDGNHPLAGIALVFSCTVSDVRAATPEEIAHGHVHGEGGHLH